GGRQTGQAEGQRVVFVAGPGAVAVLDERALALGVVVDVGDEGRRNRRRAQIHIHFFQQIGLVEGGAVDTAVRRDLLRRPVEGIEPAAARVDLGFERDVR